MSGASAFAGWQISVEENHPFRIRLVTPGGRVLIEPQELNDFIIVAAAAVFEATQRRNRSRIVTPS
jgi:hypothetical protein